PARRPAGRRVGATTPGPGPRIRCVPRRPPRIARRRWAPRYPDRSGTAHAARGCDEAGQRTPRALLKARGEPVYDTGGRPERAGNASVITLDGLRPALVSN